MFEIGKPNYYTPKLVAEIEEFEPDQYGNRWHSVVFEGDAETFMWLAKNTPEEGKAYYGHIEPTKSGKRLRFKTDKQPEGAPMSKTADKAYLKDASTIPLNIWQTLINVQGVPENDMQFQKFFETVKTHADELLDMIEKVRSGSLGAVPTPSPAIKEPKVVPPAAAGPLKTEWDKRKGEHDYGDEDDPR